MATSPPARLTSSLETMCPLSNTCITPPFASASAHSLAAWRIGSGCAAISAIFACKASK